jgi:hypothetical protein
MRRWVDIFSTGLKTSKQGVEQDFPLSRLASAVESYDPTKFRAPLIIRHDTRGVADHAVVDQPFCFGYPDELKLVGDKLRAGFDTIAPEFLEWVKNRNLISISPSFYTEDDPRNPTPGKLHVRHIAALGPEAGSDKNLNSLEELLNFSEDDAGGEFEFAVAADWLQEFEEPQTPTQIKEIVAAAIAPVVERVDALTKATVEPKIEIKELEYMEWDHIVTWAIRKGIEGSGKSTEEIAAASDITPERLGIILGKTGDATYEEMQKIVQALGIEAEFAEPTPRELSIRQREADLLKREADLRKQQVTEFMEPLVVKGQVLPGDRAALETVLLHLEASQPLEFAEGDGVAAKSPAEVLRGVLGRLKPQIEFAELAPGDDEDVLGAGSLEFQEKDGVVYDAERKRLHQKAVAYQKKHGVEYVSAVKAVGGK